MKFINVLVAYWTYFFAPKKLLTRSFDGTLIQLGVRLPIDARNEIADYLYDIYEKNRKIDKLMKREGILTNMERMSNLIQCEAFFIKDYLENPFISTTNHDFVLNVLEKYNHLNTNKQTQKKLEILHFKDNEAAFEMACNFFSPELKENMAYVGIIDSFNRSIRPNEVSLLVAIDGKSEIAFGIINEKTDIKKGDLVLWGFLEMANLGTKEYDVNIPIGIVLAIINPSFNPNTSEWEIKKDLTKNKL